MHLPPLVLGGVSSHIRAVTHTPAVRSRFLLSCLGLCCFTELILSDPKSMDPSVLISGPGHEHFRDAPRPDHPPHDGHSPASRERSSSLQGMDMASLPPRKRPWHDGSGTSEHREMEAQGGPSEDRGSKGKRTAIAVPEHVP